MHKKTVAFGEILLRFTPQNNKTIADAEGFDCFYGGSEANVSIGLASLGEEASFITVLPANDLGTAVNNNLIKYGVNTDNIIFDGDVLGTYYLNNGLNGISPGVLYNRKGSEVSKATVNSPFDYDKIFSGCDLFHISGISFALSENCRELCFKLIGEAKKRNITVSFDFNYRPKLWTVKEASAVFKEVISKVDIVFCSDKDIEAFLDNRDVKDLINENGCGYFVIRNREVIDPVNRDGKVITRHRVELKGYMKSLGEIIESETLIREFDVTDRVGSGDAFAAGMIHGLLKDPSDINSALDFALGTFIMKHIVPGDYLAKSEAEVIEFYNNYKNNN